MFNDWPCRLHMIAKSRWIALAILLLIVSFGMLIFIAGFYILGFFTALLTIGGACIYLGCVDAQEIIGQRDNHSTADDRFKTG